MLMEYLQAAMRRAQYRILDEDQTFWGEIPGIDGVWANEKTLEACRNELASALEDWILFSIWHHLPIPEIDGLAFDFEREQQAQGAA